MLFFIQIVCQQQNVQPKELLDIFEIIDNLTSTMYLIPEEMQDLFVNEFQNLYSRFIGYIKNNAEAKKLALSILSNLSEEGKESNFGEISQLIEGEESPEIMFEYTRAILALNNTILLAQDNIDDLPYKFKKLISFYFHIKNIKKKKKEEEEGVDWV